ncbi:MAG: 50S ribosome-binding GTPase [Candidatus Helarchaeota archaeon]|nr:50S ribosome-binding GTPase [Candidatus Helarchaeota archaeon]
MTSAKILSLVNVSTVPKDVQQLLEEPITIIKGAEEKDFQALQQAGINKIKDLIQIQDAEKVQKSIDSLTLEKLVTTARIIDAIAQKKEEVAGKKVIVAGLDSAGKTTIINTILDPLNYKPGDEKPTKGINYEKFNLFGFKVNLWDLGGQQIYRSDYLTEKNSDRHFGFTGLFIYVIDIQAPKRFQESYDYLNRIAAIYKHLDETPYCLILLHKSDPSLKPKDIETRTTELTKEIKKILSGFLVSFYNTSVFERGSLFLALSKGLREISVVKSILSGILNLFQEKIKSNYISLYDKTGICAAEAGEVYELLKTFTINVILSEELGIFPPEASKLILALKNGEFCIIEKIEADKEQFYLAWKGGENPEVLIHPPIIKEMEPWIVNFLQ